jgi:hypothetical protein
MSSFLYDTGRNAFLTGDIPWDSADIRCIFVDTADYTVDQNVDEFLQDIGAPARVAVSAASLANKTAVDGVADADDLTINTVSGDQFEALVLYLHTGDEATAQLIAYIDDYTGLPTTPNGGNITVAWPNGSNKIFKL